MASALYTGVVRHRRMSPVRHAFTYRVAMPLVDLDELEGGGETARLLDRLPGFVARFERSDYLGDPALPLSDEVRRIVEQRTGSRPAGSVLALTNLRTTGFNFNPITIYFCCAASGTPEAVVFEVTSTPWGERAAYVACCDERGAVHGQLIGKALHVSPFLPMDLEYRFSSSAPGGRISVRFELLRAGTHVFDADLWLTRARLDRRGLATLVLQHPLMPLRVWVSIYLQAARLYRAGAPWYRHPGRRSRRAAAVTPLVPRHGERAGPEAA